MKEKDREENVPRIDFYGAYGILYANCEITWSLQGEELPFLRERTMSVSRP